MKRRIAAWCLSLVIVLQMMTVPLAYSMQSGMGNVPCGHADTAQMHCHGGCGGCVPSHGSGACHDHGKCLSPCAHTPVLAISAVVSWKPPRPVQVSGEPEGPAFSPPLFDFLRPPN